MVTFVRRDRVPCAWLAFAGIACVAGVTSPACAIIRTVSRINDYALSFDDLRFTDTVFHLRIRQDRTADAPGDSRAESFALFPGYSNLSWQGFEGITVTNVSIGAATVSCTIVSPGGLPGYTMIQYDAPPNGTNIGVGMMNDRYTLTVSLQSGGGVDVGSPSSWRMAIPGNWSQKGTGLLQHDLISYNAAWTLVQDFVYDPALNETVFELSTDSYSVPPAPNFRLHGIPAPGTVALLALGAAGALGRRHRSARRAAD